MPRRKAPRISDALLEHLLAEAYLKTAFETDGLPDELKKILAERARRRDGPSSAGRGSPYA